MLTSRKTKIVTQGISGRQGRHHVTNCLAYARGKDAFVSGVLPAKISQSDFAVPTFSAMQDSVVETDANASLVLIPPSGVLVAISEAVRSVISFVVCVSEGVLTKDALAIVNLTFHSKNKPLILGPNSPGAIVPHHLKIGIMPTKIFRAGTVTIISRSGTLTYEVVAQLSEAGFGQSVAAGIGGDLVCGLDFVRMLSSVRNGTAAGLTVLVGEIGGTTEMLAASFVRCHVRCPVLSLLAGSEAPRGKKMGHAGALVSAENERSEWKVRVSRSCGLVSVGGLSVLGKTVGEVAALSSWESDPSRHRRQPEAGKW